MMPINGVEQSEQLFGSMGFVKLAKTEHGYSYQLQLN